MGAPFPGPYSFAHHPWCREIHNSKAAFTVAMKAAQLGITEAGINRAFFTLDQLKRDVLYVLPTSLNASDFSKARFATALNLSPYLKSAVRGHQHRWLEVHRHQRPCTFAVPAATSNLKSIPVSELILDELDEMDPKAIWLALERLSGQVEKHVVAISTPKVPKYGIHKLFLTSTQEHFYFKCPCCGRWTEFVWPDCVEIIGETVSDPRCAESFIKCKECKHRLEQQAKPEFLAGGLWQPTNPKADPQESRGFYANQLYSSTVTPGELVIAYFRGQGDEVANKEFHNSKLGLPFIGENAQVTDAMLDNAVRKHTIRDVRPADGGRRCITMGVDQGKTGYISVVEWKFDGDPRIDINLAALGQAALVRQVPRGGLELPRPIDARVAGPRLRGGRRSEHQRRPPVRPQVLWATSFESLSARAARRRKSPSAEEDTGSPMATVDRTNWLSCTLGRFKANPSRLLLPEDISVEYRDHLKNLVRTYEKDDHGNPEADLRGDRARPLRPCAVYADIALTFAAIGRRHQHRKGLMMASKRCTKCTVEKPLGAFQAVIRTAKDGQDASLQGVCESDDADISPSNGA